MRRVGRGLWEPALQEVQSFEFRASS